jgi:hypothetical protein
MNKQATLPHATNCHEKSPNGARALANLQVLAPDHPERAALRRFISDKYLKDYGAELHHFAEYLIGLRRTGDPWSAGLGYTLAEAKKLFVEQYLDQPVEIAITTSLGIEVRRDQIVEVGNLAASSAGAARRVIIDTTTLLNRMNRSWVVFTATRSLLNSFLRLGISPVFLARADPARLADRGISWGSYYDTEPQVMIANIHLGFVQLSNHQLPPEC